MPYKLTSREDLQTTQFWWRHAFLILWFAFVLLVSNQLPQIALYLFVVAPLAGWVIAWILPGTPYDFQGMLFVGTVSCSLIAGGIFSTLRYSAPGYTLLTRIADLSELAGIIVIGMLIGFFGGRYTVKHFHLDDS